MDARKIVPGTADWPSQLESLEGDEPTQLWCRGQGSLRMLALRSIAIVGCRDASAYGRAVAADFAGELSTAGWTIISGAAFGIDAAAHRGTLAAGGCTVAVLPGGVDVPVPRAHQGLLADIADRGLVVAECESGVQPRRHTFLIRNRLIAALPRAVLVVEADRRSGSLNTARRAGALGRIVMANPGPITGTQSRGTHELIRSRRAELVTTPEEVLELVEPLGSRLGDFD